ncbi:MAG: bifunctional 23S rRNA (guanine(2069)-N(7))-methyltransferase RlmK/23S rRNA (guanine(2445)-N(2))-methyltransferase RlmL [Thermodesulfobacteriota bacterium]|nr:bifunctional 23S rRNA (guanine(2069)-N(7))-methyltransferase RlmK/23S rRNA (guanine(2445)-N(2))-methyltransferase RlmL [Thermodesulfobacteriota bacterium]
MASEPLKYFATSPTGLELLLVDELESFGATKVRQTRGGVEFFGDMEVGYRSCLWSRLAGRILMPLIEQSVENSDQLYQVVNDFAWESHFEPSATMAVDCNLSSSQITHSRYAALKVKDAVVDRFRDKCGERPNVEVRQPDWRLNVWIYRDTLVLSIDLSGDSLHRRGYRTEGGRAPLKENLAAALLLRAGWGALSQTGAPFIDPMCGSGTLAIEAALIAGDCAPGMLREYYGFLHWQQHDAELWQRLLEQAQARREKGMESLPRIVGYDRDPRAIKNAWANAQRAGVECCIHFERRELQQLGEVDDFSQPGLLITNPPYGERLGEKEEVLALYTLLGEKLREQFIHWNVAVFTVESEFGQALAMRASGKHIFYNGALKCQLLHFKVEPENFFRPPVTASHGLASVVTLSDGAQMFANRMRKNLKRIKRWAGRNGISCYRVYDADLPEYAVAVDVYEDRVHVQEYQAPATIDERLARRRLREVVTLLPELLQVDPEFVYVKTRKRQRGSDQYDRHDQRREFFEVYEGGFRFKVNLADYLDTGLFLDHRLTRGMIRDMASGRDFLNLFAYTGSVSVYAAAGGAKSTTTVDMSSTYTAWAKENLELNGYGAPDHQVVCANCLPWLEQHAGKYGLIFLDPPTFSNSKKMDDCFDVQRDHVALIHSACRLLNADGTLIFSNNMRRFKMDSSELAELNIENISRKTLPQDFERTPYIHNSWRITHG